MVLSGSAPLPAPTQRLHTKTKGAYTAIAAEYVCPPQRDPPGQG